MLLLCCCCIFVCVTLLIYIVYSDMEALAKELPSGKYYMDSRAYTEAKEMYGRSENVAFSTDNITRIVNWDLLEPVIFSIISEGKDDFVVPNLVRDEIDAEVRLQYEEETKTYIKDKLKFLQNRNGQPVITGKWRKEPYPKRSYEKVTDYLCASCLSNDEGTELLQQLDTPLNGFLGQAYNYDDYQLSEEWMVTFKDGLSAAPSENEIIRNQIESILELLTIQVQDKVCNEVGVLAVEPLGLGSKLEERYVWGMDCYTRRMIDIAIEDNVEKDLFSVEKSKLFVERKLLPAINAQQPENAHNMKYALQHIVDGHASGGHGYSNDDVVYANAVLKNIQEIGIDIFRIHPKGTGVICVAPEGIPPHVFISEYLGEMYPPYRWCERLDVIGQAQETFGLKPTLPDFYNILLERPRQDTNGYNVIYVDASQKANMGSSCSHSCNSNLTTAVVARNGKLCIALCTTRYIYYGEELTMDYYSITSSEIEWRAAICLCGQSTCRGSFLNYATQDDLQQVLNQNCGPLWRYSSLLVACSMNNRSLSAVDEETLARHGISNAALGKNCPNWMKKYAADNLKFVELERKALPCALMRPKNGVSSPYTFSSADMDARIVMEQRLQSLICSYSMVSRVLEKQPAEMRDTLPLRPYTASEAIEKVWSKVVKVIPGLLEKHLLLESGSKSSKKNPVSNGTASDVVVTDDMIKQTKARVQNAIKECQEIVCSTQPANMSILRKCILDLRKALLVIEDLSTATAKVGLLADMLIFWANTTNFSSPQLYSSIESDSITVPARELGTNILRKNVCKEPVMKRFKEKASAGATVTADTSVTVAQTCSVVNHQGPAILDPNEPVYNSKKVYSSMFTFYQLLDWYNAGTDEKLTPPELFGCVQLPEPSQCFGSSEVVYGPKQRSILIKHLKDTKAQLLPWPNAIKTCFSFPISTDLLYGSPMLDVPLGKVDAVGRVLKEFNEECNSIRGINDEEDGPQFDEWLAPENNVNWVQCEDCKKWRRVAFHVDNESLPETWYCSMNFWDPDSASCSVAQDSWDTNAEVTLSYGKEVEKEKTFVEDSWWDVYCNKNNIYYEGQVKQIKAASAAAGSTDPVMVKFHFKGWSSKFDEWISSDSDRIKEHNLFTLPSTSKVNPREQEKWQGFRGLIIENKKRKSIEGSAGTTSGRTDSEKKRKLGTTRKKRTSFNKENSSSFLNISQDETLSNSLDDGECVLFEPFIQG